MFCTECGLRINKNAKFCSSCGTNQDFASQPTQSSQTASISELAKELSLQATEVFENLTNTAEKRRTAKLISYGAILVLVVVCTLAISGAFRTQPQSPYGTDVGTNTDVSSNSGNETDTNNQQPQQSCSWQVVPNTNYIPGSNTSGFNNPYTRQYICN